MSLSGHAAALADQAGIAELAVSLTHEGDVAAAVVVALCRHEADVHGAVRDATGYRTIRRDN